MDKLAIFITGKKKRKQELKQQQQQQQQKENKLCVGKKRYSVQKGESTWRPGKERQMAQI